MRRDEVDLVLDLLDEQLVDAHGRRCGRVDDIELRGAPGEPTAISALITGAGAWPWRLPQRLAPLLRGLTPPYVRRISLLDVADVTTAVQLRVPRREIELPPAGDGLLRWVGRPYDATLLLSDLLGRRVVTRSGAALGRLWDLRARRLPAAVEGSDETWVLADLLAGRRAVLDRFGALGDERGESDEARPRHERLDWRRIEELRDGAVVVSD